MRGLLLAAGLVGLARAAAGQTGGPAPAGPGLSLEAFHAQVLAHHPVARAARLARDQAEQDVRIARGAFDPTLAATWDRKGKKGTDAFNDVEAELKVPTSTGADVKVGYQRGVGPDVNPQAATAGVGQLTLGVSLPLGQRLVTDERRNALAQARAALDFADADRTSAVNALLLRAVRDYARWFEATRRAAIARDGLALAEFRLRAIQSRFRNGEAAAFDTLEARLEVQRRDAQRVEAEQARFVAGLVVEAYLWDARGGPVALEAGTEPDAAGFAPEVDSARVGGWLAAAERAHPELVKLAARIRQAEAQRLFLGQQLIPFASLDLGTLADGDRAGDLASPGDWADRYKFGATFRSPLFYLRERGRYSQVLQRLDQQRALEAQLRRDVRNAVLAAAADVRATDRQVALQRGVVEQARLLLAGETRRFESGESSLLVVNLRERLVLDEAQRLAAAEARTATVRAELAVAIGAPARLP